MSFHKFQDDTYEESEVFYIDLSDPVMGILENPTNSSITITDKEDGGKIL